jgi:hypothetical protein
MPGPASGLNWAGKKKKAIAGIYRKVLINKPAGWGDVLLALYCRR